MSSEPEDDKTQAHPVLSKGTMVSHYRILGKLGGGGMGVVYKAEDIKLKRPVALKFLSPELTHDPEAKERFIHEAQAASALDHPNICTIHEIDETEDGQMFITMAYYEGETVKKKIERGPLKLKQAIDITMHVAQGLVKAHSQGIVHRDIKPANIFITEDGQVKIVDFGLAKLASRTRITKTGTTLGTVAYLSPEQARGEEVDHRSDIWSLGVVLYEMLTGQLPFKGEYEQAVVYSILNEEAQPITSLRSGVPMELERMVSKALDKDVETRYQSAAGLLPDLKRARKALQPATAEPFRAPSPPKKVHRRILKRLLVPGSAVALIVLLVLILKPWKFEVRPTQEVVAAQNRLAVMYFDNLTDPEDSQRLGEMVSNLLIADLSESHYVQVVSSQRVYDILKLLGIEGTKKVDRDVASQVARKANAKWMLLGSILEVEPQITLMSQLVEVATGDAIASQRITGDPGEKIFSMVDKLTVEVKKDLSLPAQAQKEEDPLVAGVTTHSPEAYRYYLEGLEYDSKLYYVEAEKSYRKALEFDSTFAMAYFRLAYLRSGPEKKKLIAKAVEYSDKVSRKERHYIKSLAAIISGGYAQGIKELQKIVERHPEEKEAFYWLGAIYYGLRQFEEAVRHFNKAIEIDPLYKTIYNDLAYAYDQIGDFDKSIWAINQYISLAPDEANPYDSRADLYAYNGKIDQAIQSYKKALEIKSDFYPSLVKLGHMHLFKREYAKAESCYKELCSSNDKDARSEGRTYLAYIPRYQGKLEQALEVLDQGIGADRMEQAEGVQNAIKHFSKADIYEKKKNVNLALKEAEKAIKIWHSANPYDKVYWRHYYVWLLVENNHFQKAEEVAEALKKDIEEKDQTLMYSYWYALGGIELARGNLQASLINFEKAARDVPFFYVHFMLAKAYLESDRLGEAVAELEKLLSRYDEVRAYFAIWAVKAHYLLGLAYKKSGWNKKAIEQYEEFLDIWKDADPGIPEIEDANERLKKLGVGS